MTSDCRSRRRRARARAVAIVLLLPLTISLIGCGTAPTPSDGITIATEGPEEAQAIQFRDSFGLRSDLPYVRAVAADPAASSREFSVPLLPGEIAELNARAANADEVTAAINAYADAHPDEFGGIYLDQEQGAGAVTTLWTAHLDEHAAAIRALLRPGVRIAFREVTFTYRDLQALQDRISADWDWLRPLAIAPTGVGVDVIGNRVEIDVSTVRPDAADLVKEHYAAPGMIDVISDGTGAALVPEGTVRGRAVDILGRPPGAELAGQLNLGWTSDGPGDCGGGDIGYGLNPDGSFRLPCQAGGHTIEVQIPVPNDGWKTIGSAHVVAVGGGTVDMLIVVTGAWPAAAP